MFRKLFLHSPVRYIVGFVMAVIIALLILWSKGFEYKISYVDAFQVSGALVFFMGCLSLASFFGAFEIFGYSFSGFRRREYAYKDYYEYQKIKAEQRSKMEYKFVPFMTVGLVFFITGCILSAVLLK